MNTLKLSLYRILITSHHSVNYYDPRLFSTLHYNTKEVDYIV